jgi:head-tail adaptor
VPAAGRLDRLVDIEREQVTQGETGEEERVWVIWRQVYMGKRDIRGEERFDANQELATETTVWTSHWIEGIGYEDRLRPQGEPNKVYDIVGLAELGRRSGLEITAKATRVE